MIVFSSAAKDLVAQTGVGNSYIYARNLRTHFTTRLALDTVDEAGVYRVAPAISADGRFVIHQRALGLNPTWDITMVLSDLKNSLSAPYPVFDPGFNLPAQTYGVPGVSPDGRFVSFATPFGQVFPINGNPPYYVGGAYLSRLLFP